MLLNTIIFFAYISSVHYQKVARFVIQKSVRYNNFINLYNLSHLL